LLCLIMGVLLSSGQRSVKNVACFYYNSSIFGRFNFYECLKLQTEMAQVGFNIILYNFSSADPFGSYANATNGTNNGLVISVDSEFTPGLKKALNTWPDVTFVCVRTALPLPNETIPNNTIWIQSFEPSIWYFKGVLAALFSNVSDFCMDIPRLGTSQYIMATNFYYAGLKSVRPNATLTAVNSFMPSFTERQAILKCLQKVPNLQVMANMHSRLFYPPLIEEFGLYDIEQQLGLLSPFSDVVGILGFNRTLVTTVWNYFPILQKVLLDLNDGKDLRRSLTVTSRENNTMIVRLSRMSPLIPDAIADRVLKLQDKFLFKQNDKKPQLYCEDNVKSILKAVVLIPNNECIELGTGLFSSVELHPDIPVYNIDP